MTDHYVAVRTHLLPSIHGILILPYIKIKKISGETGEDKFENRQESHAIRQVEAGLPGDPVLCPFSTMNCHASAYSLGITPSRMASRIAFF